jgi:uncharacterized membrane protein YeiH
VSFDLLLVVADCLGVFVFAVSGGIVAVRKDMDLLGAIVLGLVTAVGGGTLRDLVLGVPVFWLADQLALALGVAGALAAFLLYRRLEGLKPLRWADAIGLSVFAVAGAAKAAGLGHGVVISLIMGVMTASAGGLLRDVIANHDPLLLQEDVYATAALAGASAYAAMHFTGAPETAAFAVGLAAAFLIRAAAIRFGLHLPKARR